MGRLKIYLLFFCLIASSCSKIDEFNSFNERISSIENRLENLENNKNDSPKWVLWESKYVVSGNAPAYWIMAPTAVSAYSVQKDCQIAAAMSVPLQAQLVSSMPLLYQAGKITYQLSCLPAGIDGSPQTRMPR